jgi:methylenetetrahydrofolate reductase (NADPH)
MSFKDALRTKDFVIAAELPLSPDSTRDSIVESAKVAGEHVDGYLLTDNQYGKPHLSPSAAASVLVQAGLSPILQLSCRNRNRIALIGELLGARALGIDSIMLVRGTVVPEGFKPRPKAVMDLTIKELIATAKVMNEDEKLASGNEFLIAASSTAHKPAKNWQPEELTAKSDAGAQLIISQLCMDTEMMRDYTQALIETHLTRRLSIMFSIAIITSPEMAVWLNDNRRKAVVPPDVVARLRDADDPVDEGITIAAEVMRETAAIPGVAGVNFVAAGDTGLIPEVVARSGVFAES